MTSSLPPQPLAELEQNGVKFAKGVGGKSLADLRAMTAELIQEAMTKVQGVRFSTALDGYFLPKTLTAIYEAGEQAKIPLLAGSNTQEQAIGARRRRSHARNAGQRDQEILRRQSR
jgi:para-nitrobenzyl esterase